MRLIISGSGHDFPYCLAMKPVPGQQETAATLHQKGLAQPREMHDAGELPVIGTLEDLSAILAGAAGTRVSTEFGAPTFH